MERTEVDGVPVLWVDGPAPFAGGLLLGVGRRDEGFIDGGLTHLVEHLVMGSLGRSTLEANATVDLSVTEFTATGSPEEVAAFLERVCRALSDVPVDRLSVEAGVLRAEEGHVAPAVVEALLGERYGPQGAGLAAFREPALGALTPDDVRAWAARYAVCCNAAVWLSGPPPPGLRLPLPHAPGDGPRPAQHRRTLVVPALTRVALDGVVALGADVDRTPGLGAALRVLGDRLEDDLRHRRGLTYSVAVDQLLVEDDRRFAVVTADVRGGQEAVAARALWGALSRLAEEGPTDAELAHDRAGLAAQLADPRAGLQEARSVAAALVRGTPPRTAEQLRAEADALTAEQVREAAAGLQAQALLAVPVGADVRLRGVKPAPDWSAEVLPGRVHRRRRGSDAPRGSRLHVGDEGITLVLDDDERLTVRYADVVGLLQVTGDDLMLLGLEGWSVPLSPRDWKDGEDAVARVRAAVPGRLQVREDTGAGSGRSVVLAAAAPHVVAEALWPAVRDAWMRSGERWTLVVRDHDIEETYVEAAGLSGALGRKGPVLLLALAHGELELVVLHRGREQVRHVWTGEEQDPSVLTGLLDLDPEEAARLLALDGPPEQVLAEVERVMGLPPEAAEVLLGTAPEDLPGLVHEPARGLRESFRATMRGAHDPPDSKALHHRLTRWQRERPPAYRRVQVGLALGQAGLAAALAYGNEGDLSSWGGVLAVLFGLGALSSAWDARPPSRDG